MQSCSHACCTCCCCVLDLSGNGHDLSGTGFYESDRRLDSPGVTDSAYYNEYSLFWDTTASGMVTGASNILSLSSDFSVSVWFKVRVQTACWDSSHGFTHIRSVHSDEYNVRDGWFTWCIDSS